MNANTQVLGAPAWWLAAVMIPLAAATQVLSAPVEVEFTTQITAADLTIHRLAAEVADQHVKFVVSYTSGRERNLSFFDPPDGAALLHRERAALKKGSGEATFVLPLAKVQTLPHVAMGFSAVEDPENDRNFILLRSDVPAVREIFGKRGTGVRGGNDSRPAFMRVSAVDEVKSFADLRWKDASGVAGLDAERIAGLVFNQATRWNAKDEAIARPLLERAMNPGLGVRRLHDRGITGTGVSVGIVDQNIHLDHPEFKERIARYKDVGCNAPNGSMHGPAVASLLVGKNIGTAPGARLYFAAAPSWTRDAKYQADALNWLLDVNETLPSAEKIRVVSVSAAPSGEGSPFTQNGADWDAACERAAKAGVLVLDCTRHRGLIGMCYYDLDAPDDVARVTPGRPGGRKRAAVGSPDHILAPASRRTQAEEYIEGEFGYQYGGVGGLSWSIPYTAGVLALGWQVNPQLSAEKMVELLRATAYEKDGAKIINPLAFIEAVKRETEQREQRLSQPPPR